MKDTSTCVLIVIIFILAHSGFFIAIWADRTMGTPDLVVGGVLGCICMWITYGYFYLLGSATTNEAMRELRRALNSMAADSKVDYRHRKAIADIITKYEEP